jgi:hypothetical protein
MPKSHFSIEAANSRLTPFAEKSYKKECQEKNLPFGSVPKYFLGIQPQ